MYGESMKEISVQPFTANHFQNLKVLSKNDINDPKWRFAPVVVTHNAQILLINQFKVIEFAIWKNVPVIAWRATLSTNTEVFFSRDTNAKDSLFQKCNELVSYFVEG